MPAVLQPFVHVIIDSMHIPPPLQSDVVSTSAAHTGRAHSVIGGSFPVSMHMEVPESQSVTPVLQRLPPG